MNESITVPLALDGGTIRVAVGEVGRRSEIWRIWANRSTADVYIAARSVANVQRFSLHQSGRWRFAFTANAAPDWADADRDRAIDKWDRPPADDLGWLAAVAIEIRDRDVVSFPDDTRPQDVQWIAPPPPGHYVSIRLSLIYPDRGPLRDAGGRFVGALGLADGSAVLIVAAVQPIQPERWAAVDAARTDALRRIRPVTSDPGLRLAVFANDEPSRIRYVFDTAVTADDLADLDDAV